MSEREYIVSLKRGVDADQFNQDMIKNTGSGVIPNRGVDVANKRPGSYRNTHYALTEQEALALKNDPRVADVELPPSELPVKPFPKAVQTGNFNKSTSEGGQYYDWGKIRHSYSSNQYGAGSTVGLSWPYALDGTGVDVVIQDSGIQADHPEFNDKNGVSRVQQINWYTESGLSGFQSSNHYRDLDGHGTHCAGTAAGLTFGWAKGARIYSVKVSGLEGSGDSGTGISVTDCFNVIKLWHRNKPIDPVTGVKRPTIVNMSWGYGGYYGWEDTTDSLTYRGVTYSGTDTDSTSKRLGFGLGGGFAGNVDGYALYRYNSRITSVDTDIQELIDEGVHVCIAAGNNYHKIDVSTGNDYNNIAFCRVYSFGSGTLFSGNFTYNRGSSPYDDEAFSVGNINDSTLPLSNPVLERKAFSSEAGPGVNMYAAGTNIISCTSNTNKFADATYYGNSNYRQCNISGTSMASPQVCGVGALYLQSNPFYTPAQLRSAIINDAVTNGLNDTGDTSYSDYDSIMGGNNVILQSRYAQSVPYNFTVSGTSIGFK